MRADESTKIVSERIAERRKDLNLTQQDLALLLDVKRGCVANWETNTNEIPLGQLVQVALHLRAPSNTSSGG